MNKLRTERILKLASEKKKERGYFETAAKVAPVFLTKSVIGDLPRNLLKKNLEARFAGKTPKKSWGKAMKMTGLGAGVGLATAPVFLKGVQLARSDKRSDKIKGIGMIAGSGTIFQAAKGFGEGGRIGALSRIIGKSPAIIGTGLALATTGGKKGKKQTMKDKYLKPALIAAAAGGVQGAVDQITRSVGKVPKGGKLPKLKRILSTRKGLKSLVPRVGAGAIAGGLGGIVATAVVDKAVKALKE